MGNAGKDRIQGVVDHMIPVKKGGRDFAKPVDVQTVIFEKKPPTGQ
jgi:hypothetical protein